MTELADDRPKVPKPPDPRMFLAVALELAMVATFIAHRSWFGLLLALAYGWFSATRAMLFDAFHE